MGFFISNFVPDMYFCIFWDIFRPKIPMKKKTFVNGIAGTNTTRVQTIRIYLQNTASTFGL